MRYALLLPPPMWAIIRSILRFVTKKRDLLPFYTHSGKSVPTLRYKVCTFV